MGDKPTLLRTNLCMRCGREKKKDIFALCAACMADDFRESHVEDIFCGPLVAAAREVLDLWADGELGPAPDHYGAVDIEKPFQALDEALLPFKEDAS